MRNIYPNNLRFFLEIHGLIKGVKPDTELMILINREEETV